MGFFGDPQSPPRGLRMRIFDFALDRKIPGDRDWGFGIPKILSKTFSNFF